MTESINFFTERSNYKLYRKSILKLWILDSIKNEKFQPGNLNIVLCNDSFLSGLNRKYLKKDTLTDILTFSFSDRKNELAGDIYISVPRVKENAKRFKTLFREELYRVIIHGVLHLAGYDDTSEKEKELMRERENFYLKELRRTMP